MWGAIGAVFKSWNNARANAYRKLNNIPASWGTAVNVQCMVFGNIGPGFGHGRRLHAEPLDRGERLLRRISPERPGRGRGGGDEDASAHQQGAEDGSFRPFPRRRDARSYKQLLEIRATLERHFKDMQDVEFTIQRRKLWMLQTRTGKRTSFAEFKIAVDMVNEGLIDKEEALMRVSPDGLNQILRPIFDPKEVEKALKEREARGQGSERRAGRGDGQGRLQRGRRRKPGRPGKKR